MNTEFELYWEVIELHRNGKMVANGVRFENGKCVLHWKGEHQSIVIWESLDDLVKVNGHTNTQIKIKQMLEPRMSIKQMCAERMSVEIKKCTCEEIKKCTCCGGQKDEK